MKSKLLFTIAGIFFLVSFQVFSSISSDLNQNMEMQSETQIANGNVITVKVHSQGIANNMLGDSEYRKVSIYLPPGYVEKSGENYPVIYFLSGENGTNEDWFLISGERSFPEILNKLIQSGTIKPMIMVFPDGRNKLGGCWYTNSPATGNWEDFVVTDVVKYIDQNYRTLPFAASRGIAGKGMGGYGALKLATKHPDVFSAVYSLNAMVDFETIINHEYLWKSSFTIASKEKVYPTSDAFANQLLGMAVAFSPDMFNPAIGKLPKTETGEILPSVRQQWLEHDPLYMIQGNLRNLKALKVISIDCSTSDAGIMLNGNYSEMLKSKRIKHTFNYFNGNGNEALLKRVTNVLLPVFSANLAHTLLETDAKSFYTHNEVLKAKLITDGSIYIVQNETSANLKSNEGNNTIKLDVKANKLNEIPLTNITKGIYRIYGVSNNGFAGKSHEFGLNGGKPDVKICVTDSETGEKIKLCGVKINDKCFTSDDNGEVTVCEGGNISLCFDKENYCSLEKSALVFTDTTLQFSLAKLVKEVHLQVIERGIGMPVYEAMVTHDNVAILTGKDGFASLQNLQSGMLDCRIFKTGYFPEILHTTIKPGQTVVVELTSKKANVEFILVGTEGHLQEGAIKMGKISLKPDEFGKAHFTGLDTRVEYTYTIENASYETVQGSVFIEANTILPIYLEPRNTGVSQLKSEQLATGINEQMASEILIYPNPATDAVTVQSNNIKGFTVELKSATGTLIYKTKTEGTLQQINLSNLSNGVYFVTVKSDNFYHTRKIMKL